MKSLKRLGIDPLAVYGTLCVKCPVGDPSLADPACIARVAEELAIVQPRIVVAMGEDALAVLNDLDVPLSRTVEPVAGRRAALTPSMDGARTSRTSTRRSTRRRPSARSGRPSGCWASGTRTCRLLVMAAAGAGGSCGPRPSCPTSGVGTPRRSWPAARACSASWPSRRCPCPPWRTRRVLVARAPRRRALLVVALARRRRRRRRRRRSRRSATRASGVAFAAVLDAAALALALPVFLAVVDVVSIAGGGPGRPAAHDHGHARATP